MLKYIYILIALVLTCKIAVKAQVKNISSISSTDFTELNFLQEELKNKKIVMLGEPSHQEGNVFTAKIKLIKFLHEKMGYNVIAFESGFFEVQQAQEDISNGLNPVTALEEALFPIWTKSDQFSPLLQYISEHKNDLKVIGFDSQFSANKARLFLPALKKFIISQGLPYTIDEVLLSDVFLSLQDENRFPDNISYNLFFSEMKKIIHLLEVISLKQKKNSQPEVWIQNIRSILSLAKDFHQNKIDEKSSEEFRARDSNPRDQQMAENLLFWSNHFIGEKIICWGASLHFSNEVNLLNNEELKDYIPMGKLVRDKLGRNAVYTIATVSSSGKYGSWFDTEPKIVPQPLSGSLEYNLEKTKTSNFLYIDNLDLKKMGIQTTSMFDYTPVSGDWSKVIDGIMYFSAYEPSLPSTTRVTNDSTNLFIPILKAKQNKISQTNIKIRNLANFVISGRIISEDDNSPINSATIMSDTEESAISKENGEFKLFSIRKTRMIRVSCIGYLDTNIVIDAEIINVKLKKNIINLEEVNIKPNNGRASEIIKNTISAFKKNLNSTEHKIDFYVDSRVNDKDSVVYEVEYTGSFYSPKDNHEKYLSKVEEVHWIKNSQSKDQLKKNIRPYLDGYMYINNGNIVRQHPMFDISSISKYKYDILEENANQYTIVFESRSLSHAITNGYYLKKLSGQIVINKSDLGITRTELNYVLDTTTLNKFARNYEKKKENKTILFSKILESDKVDVLTDYKKGDDGYYYPIITQILRNQKGWEIETKHPIELRANAKIKFINVSNVIEMKDDYQKILNFNKAKYNKLFWEKYKRPFYLGQ